MSDRPNFASRWSDRKRLVAKEEEEQLAVDDSLDDATVEREGDDRSDTEILAELGLKDPDEMGLGDDFSAFMKSEIPARLKKRALRKLWTSNPVLACVDGLNDYDGDYTDIKSSSGLLKSAYEVGKGYSAKWEREAAEKEAMEQFDSDAVDTEIATASDISTSEPQPILSSETENSDTTQSEPPLVEADQPAEEPINIARKRMNFQFD